MTVIWIKIKKEIKIVNKIVTREKKEIGIEIEGVTGIVIVIEIEIDDVGAVAKKEIETRGEEEVEAGTISNYYFYNYYDFYPEKRIKREKIVVVVVIEIERIETKRRTKLVCVTLF